MNLVDLQKAAHRVLEEKNIESDYIEYKKSDKQLDKILKTILIENPNIDESNISYIKKQYSMHWKQRLLSENIQLDSSLVFQCFFHFKRQFMQIKCTPNILYSPTHIA